MTTRTTALPTTGEHQHMIENRAFERLIKGINAGTVRLDPNNYHYRNTINGTDMDDVAYAAENKGLVELPRNGNPTVTAAGKKWLADRYATFGPSPTRPLFLAPDPEAARAAARSGAYRGERINTARLTEAQVRDIHRRLADGETVRALAREYGVSDGSLSQIKNGKSWRHVA